MAKRNALIILPFYRKPDFYLNELLYQMDSNTSVEQNQTSIVLDSDELKIRVINEEGLFNKIRSLTFDNIMIHIECNINRNITDKLLLNISPYAYESDNISKFKVSEKYNIVNYLLSFNESEYSDNDYSEYISDKYSPTKDWILD